ncbi:hypothetical protein JCM10295v2_000926 [Rhodotorula toruloides]
MATHPINRTASAQAAKYNYYLERRAAWLELRSDCQVGHLLASPPQHNSATRRLRLLSVLEHNKGSDARPALPPYTSPYLISPYLISAVRAHLMQQVYSQASIRPEAPWRAFVEARFRLLNAFLDYRRLCLRTPGRSTPSSPSPADRQDGPTLDKAFAKFSLALDAVTIPVGYWSEMPREDVGSDEAHRELLSCMQDLEERFRSLAQ